MAIHSSAEGFLSELTPNVIYQWHTIRGTYLDGHALRDHRSLYLYHRDGRQFRRIPLSALSSEIALIASLAFELPLLH